MERNFDYFVSEFSKLACGRSDSDRHHIHYLLDSLNALNYKDCTNLTNDRAVLVIHQCCTLVTPSDTFLVAKCSHLIMNFVSKVGIRIDGKSLCVTIYWCCQALKLSADVALIDVLQALHVVINSQPSSIEEVTKELMPRLGEELENRASLLIPQEVKAWRIRCIHALLMTGSLTPAQVSYSAEIVFNILTNNPKLDDSSHVQVIACCIEALQGLGEGNTKWLSEHLGDVIGVIMSYLHCGLPGWNLKPPERLFPLPMPTIPHCSNPKGPVNHRKQRTKAIKQGLKSKHEENNMKHDQLNVCEVNWPTSDSDFSDNEGGRGAKLSRAHSKVRLAVLNLILHTTKLGRSKELFGYCSSLLGNVGLSYSIVKDPVLRVRCTAISATTVLLSMGKGLFAHAQQSESSSFTPFSEVLADLLKLLHSCVIEALSQRNPSLVCTSLLHCSAVLITCTPYHRMEAGLITHLLHTVHPFLKLKERNTTVAVLTCVGAIVTLEPTTEEIEQLISSSTVDAEEESSQQHVPRKYWLPELCVDLINDSLRPVQVSVEAWQVINHMSQSHFSLLLPHLESILDALHLSLNNASDVVQLHAAKALERIAPLMAASKDTEVLCVQTWSRLLKGSLLTLLQSSNALAAVSCDCAANIGANVYQLLPEDLQILCITLLFGCAGHEEPSVRAAAIRAIAIFLSYPSLADDEQFIFDVSEIVIRLLKDPSVAVRIKAAWSLGKLTETLLECECEEVYSGISLENLFNATLDAIQDTDHVLVGAVRALGYLIRLLKPEHVSQQVYKALLEKSAASLTRSATVGSNMKLRWNACYAVSSLFENKAVLVNGPASWQDQVITSLCNIIMKCNNFKVRVNASHALSCVSERQHYGTHYFLAWQTILDGLDNAYNMPDFREFKHQNILFDQLCINLCQLTRFVDADDLISLHDILVYRLDTAKEHIQRFQKTALPEQTNPVLAARNHLSSLTAASTSNSSTHQASLTMLNNIFPIEL